MLPHGETRAELPPLAAASAAEGAQDTAQVSSGKVTPADGLECGGIGTGQPLDELLALETQAAQAFMDDAFPELDDELGLGGFDG